MSAPLRFPESLLVRSSGSGDDVCGRILRRVQQQVETSVCRITTEHTSAGSDGQTDVVVKGKKERRSPVEF